MRWVRGGARSRGRGGFGWAGGWVDYSGGIGDCFGGGERQSRCARWTAEGGCPHIAKVKLSHIEKSHDHLYFLDHVRTSNVHPKLWALFWWKCALIRLPLRWRRSGAGLRASSFAAD